MTVRQSKLFIVAFVVSLALLATAGYAAIDERRHSASVCQCEGP